MTAHVNNPSIAISASTTTASGTLPLAANKRFVRVVNGSTSICYCTTGSGSATATSANIAVGPSSTEIFEKPLDHDTLAVLLSASTGIVTASCMGTP